MVVVLRETYKLEAEIYHALTDEEYEQFRKMTDSEKFDFLKDQDRTMCQEEIMPIGQSSKFKKIKISSLSEDMKIIANRMTK